jgi:hypothetical protein
MQPKCRLLQEINVRRKMKIGIKILHYKERLFRIFLISVDNSHIKLSKPISEIKFPRKKINFFYLYLFGF